MGEKADLRARVAELEHRNQELERIVEAQHGSLNFNSDEPTALALTGQEPDHALAIENEELRRHIADVGRPLVMVTDKHDAPAPTRDQIAAALGVELGENEVLTDEGILVAISKIKGDDKNPSDDLGAASKRDSLAEAMHANLRQRQELTDRLTTANMIVTRVASALQVGHWDKDGTEIVERAQRYENLRYWLRARIQQVNQTIEIERTSRGGADGPSLAPWLAVGDQLRLVLARLISGKELAAWLGKLSVKVTASPAVMQLAEDAPDADACAQWPWLSRPFSSRHVDAIIRAFRDWNTTHGDGALEGDMEMIINAIDENPNVRQEFVDLMNAVILPMIRKIFLLRGA